MSSNVPVSANHVLVVSHLPNKMNSVEKARTVFSSLGELANLALATRGDLMDRVAKSNSVIADLAANKVEATHSHELVVVVQYEQPAVALNAKFALEQYSDGENGYFQVGWFPLATAEHLFEAAKRHRPEPPRSQLDVGSLMNFVEVRNLFLGTPSEEEAETLSDIIRHKLLPNAASMMKQVVVDTWSVGASASGRVFIEMNSESAAETVEKKLHLLQYEARKLEAHAISGSQFDLILKHAASSLQKK